MFGTAVGAGWLWKLGVFSQPGPIVALTNLNTTDSLQRRDCLQCENCGDKIAQNITWKVRDYYSSGIRPRYDCQRGQRIGPLKVGESFDIDLKTRGIAAMNDYEVFLSYRGPSGAKFFSHFTVQTTVKRNESGLNRARWIIGLPFARTYIRHLFSNWRIWRSPGVRQFR
jgi:hypothetical protein